VPSSRCYCIRTIQLKRSTLGNTGKVVLEQRYSEDPRHSALALESQHHFFGGGGLLAALDGALRMISWIHRIHSSISSSVFPWSSSPLLMSPLTCNRHTWGASTKLNTSSLCCRVLDLLCYHVLFPCESECVHIMCAEARAYRVLLPRELATMQQCSSIAAR
jgi:hypothetical protein